MVAIILVNFNGAKDTIDCIESLNHLNYKDYRVIVVDNCSTDDSVKNLLSAQKQYKFILLKAERNNGFSSGNNVGIKYAMSMDADYYWLLNNDTLVEPDTLTLLLAGFKVRTSCGMTTGKIYFEKNRKVIWYAGGGVERKTARTEHWSYGKEDKNLLDDCQNVTFASGCCMCISKEVIKKIKGLDESYFLYEEDVEYCLRVINAGFEIVYCPKAIIYHKVSASTGARSAISQYYTIRNKYRLIRQHFKGIMKFTAYIYSTAQMLFRCMKGELTWKYYIKGFIAFVKKEEGKREKGL